VEVVLSHVCSEWRNIAINLPTLWTAFKFDTHLRVSDPDTKLEAYLYRSGKQLLELYFSFSSSDEDPPYEFFGRDFSLVETAIAHAHRWHRFTFFADQFVPTLEFINLFDELYVPNLEYLALCPSNFDPATSNVANTEDRGDLNPLILTGGAPRLYTVRIDATTPYSLPPLSNITTLAIQGTHEGEEGEYVCFEFHIFHSILTIPTLINLSIERNCLDHDWIYPVNIPRFKMPGLKTLRITQDSHILGMLSFLDAPLLETLVLHDVDLSVIIGQDIHKITTFTRLATIALLECQYTSNNRNQESMNRVDMILNTLACRATHVIISSHESLSFIERGSNLLDLNRYRWPRLQRITFDLSTCSDRMFYIRIFECSSQSITVRVVEPAFDQWTRRPGGLTTLEKDCRLEIMKVGDLMMDDPWPAPGGLFREDGHLENRYIWGETVRAKGSDWFLDE
jgi:hypothetical protein